MSPATLAGVGLAAWGAWQLMQALEEAADEAAQADEEAEMPPGTYAELVAEYGDIAAHDDPRDPRRLIVDPAWEQANIIPVLLHTGRTVRLHRAVADEFRDLFAQAEAVSGYRPRSVQTFVPRHKQWRVDRPPSVHSWGVAVDFDPKSNAVNSAAPAMPEAFARVFTDRGWFWGGDWKTYRDYMHIQAARGTI